MKNPFGWLVPNREPASSTGSSEAKSLGGSFFSLQNQLNAIWSPGDASTLAQVGFMRNPVVYRCVRMISEAASSVPIAVQMDGVSQDTHPLKDLLATPNSRQSGTEFFEALFGQLLVHGNAYVERLHGSVNPVELHTLRPDRVKVICSRTGWPEAYEYSVDQSKLRFAIDEHGVSDVLHLTLYHPRNDHYGYAPLQAALHALDIHNAASCWNKALLDNSARPSGALVYAPKEGGNLTVEQFDRLKEELEAGYTGAQRAGRPMLLEGGLDWKAMGYSPKDMDFIEAKNGAARDIALAFGVPPMLLGIPGDNTYANYKEAQRALWRQTIIPLLKRTASAFQRWMLDQYDGRLELRFDLDEVEALSTERDALWKRLNDASFLTGNEKRSIVGYAPVSASDPD
ncbi:MAG: phage portal protein [Pseudomonadota bacterium]